MNLKLNQKILLKFSAVLLLLFIYVGSFVETASAQVYPEFCQAVNRTLKYGDIGEDVKRLQVVLGQEGIAYLNATGFYGPVTMRAVKSFQSQAGIYAVGKVGPQTLARMRTLWCQTNPYEGIENNGNYNSPNISFSVTSTNGNNATLTWSTINTQFCSINGESVPTSGNRVYTINSETQFTISCFDNNNTKSESTIIVRPTQTQPVIPTINLYISPTNPTVGSIATINWNTTNTSSCSLNGINTVTNGNQQFVVPNSPITYTLSCVSSTGSVASQTISSSGSINTNLNNILSITATTNKNSYSVGEVVSLNVVLKNNTNTQITYQEPICSLYGPFNITLDGQDFYSALESGQRAICMAYGNANITLNPGESKNYNYSATIASKNYTNNSKYIQVSLAGNNSNLTTGTNITINNSGNNSSSQLFISPNNLTTGNSANISWVVPSNLSNAQGMLLDLVNSSGSIVGTIRKVVSSSGANIVSDTISWTVPKSIQDIRNDAISCQQVNGETLCGNLISSGQYKLRATYFTPSNACFGYCQQVSGQQTLGTVESDLFTINRNW